LSGKDEWLREKGTLLAAAGLSLDYFSMGMEIEVIDGD
jgi:hypothetical protein